MADHTYSLEGGRSILRDGKPFVIITATKRGDTAYVSPADMDTFARDVVRAMNMHNPLLKIVDEYIDKLRSEVTADSIDALVQLVQRVNASVHPPGL